MSDVSEAESETEYIVEKLLKKRTTKKKYVFDFLVVNNQNSVGQST